MDASKSLAMFQKLEAPIIGFVENMSQFICPHCGERTDIFSYGGGERAAAETNMDFLGRIPLNPQIVFGGDHGMPVLKSHPEFAGEPGVPRGRVGHRGPGERLGGRFRLQEANLDSAETGIAKQNRGSRCRA